jgi:cell division protein FtsL
MLMAQSNLANKIYVNKQQKIENPQNISYKLSVSRLEKTILTVGGIVVFFMMIGLVYEKISLGNNATSLQETTNSLVKVQDSNGNLKQEVSELQSGNRLQKIAKEANLSLTNKNVRNVSE